MERPCWVTMSDWDEVVPLGASDGLLTFGAIDVVSLPGALVTVRFDVVLRP